MDSTETLAVCFLPRFFSAKYWWRGLAYRASMAGRYYSQLFLQAKPSLSNPQATSQNSDALTTRSRYIRTPCLQWNRSVDNTHLYTLEIHPGSELLTFSLVQIYTHHNIPSDVLIDFILKLSRITIMPFMMNRFEDINKSGFWFVFKQFCMFPPEKKKTCQEAQITSTCNISRHFHEARIAWEGFYLISFFFTMAPSFDRRFARNDCLNYAKKDGENVMQIRFYFNVC